MPTTALAVWGEPDIARGSLAVAAVLAALAALAIVGTTVADLADLPGPAHETLLTGLQVFVALGVIVAVVNGALGTGPVVGLAPVLAPTLVIVAAMLLLPALGLSTPDTSMIGGLFLAGYVLVVAVAFGIGGFAVGRAVRWLLGRLPA